MYEQVAKTIAGALKRSIVPSGITFDSREVKERMLFFAIKGEKTDGRHFAQPVLELGGYVVADLLEAPTDFLRIEHENLILVPNVHQAILDIASKLRDLTTVIGVTGSSGKTFTKNAIATALSKYAVLVSPESYNTEYGLLLTLAKLTEKIQYTILELGVGKPGDMDLVGRIARPDLSIILPVGVAHLANFQSREDLITEKLKLLNYTKGNTVVHDSLKQFIQNKNIKYYSNDLVKLDPSFHLKGSIQIDKMVYPVENPNLQGVHLLENLAGIATLLQEMVSPPELVHAFNTIRPKAGRGIIYDLMTPDNVKFKLYDSSYNANPSMTGSMMRELDAVKKFAGDKLLVLGGMAAIGSQSREYHAEVLSYAEVISNKIILVGGDYSTDNYPHFPTLDIPKIVELLFENLTNGCIVFVKGSNLYGLCALVDELRRRFMCS